MGVAGMMSLSGAVDMAGTAGTLFRGSLYTRTRARINKYVRTCVWKKCGVHLLYLLYLQSCSYKVKGAGGKKFSACFLFERIFFVAL